MSKTPARATKQTPKEDPKQNARELARKRREEEAEKVRQARIDAGELIVTKKFEFEVSSRVTDSSKKTIAVIEKLKKEKEPVVFNELAKSCGIKYPEDHIVALHALEHVGLVKRFDAKTAKGKSGRRSVAYLWVGNN